MLSKKTILTKQMRKIWEKEKTKQFLKKERQLYTAFLSRTNSNLH